MTHRFGRNSNKNINTRDNMENEIWQVEVKGQIYEASFEELTEWIAENALLPEDNIRKGKMRWTQAGRVPVLRQAFEQKAADLPIAATAVVKPVAPAAAVAGSAPVANAVDSSGVSNNFSRPQEAFHQSQIQSAADNVCHFHETETATFACRGCANVFCRACPKFYGRVKVCPLCGEMCDSTVAVQEKARNAARRDRDLSEGFGIEDFARAWIYPFKFWQSLIFGALFVSLLSFGGIFGGLLANMILFGCISQTINQVASGNLTRNFMPNFDDFDVLSDLVKPIFLSVGVWLVTWGPFIALFLVLVGSAATTLSDPSTAVEMHQKNAETAVTESPSTQILLGERSPNTDNANVYVNQLRPPELPFNEQDMQALIDGNDPEKQRVAAEKFGEMARESKQIKVERQKADHEVMFELFGPILKAHLPVILLLALSVLWGIFYSPVALTIAGYTKSFLSTINPLVGIDTIKRMGGTYVLAFVFWAATCIIASLLFAIVSIVTKPFELPFLGNLPAKFVNGVSSFYFSLIIAFILGSALYKTSDRLDIKPE